MKILNNLSEEMEYVTAVMEVIEKANGNPFRAKDFEDERLYTYSYISGQTMSALVRRGLIEVVGKGKDTYTTVEYGDGYKVTKETEYEYNIYQQVHSIEWYKEVLINAAISKIR